MFRKILVAEDFDTYNIAIAEALKTFDLIDVENVAYCDDALLRVRKCQQEGSPFDLMITDLSFKPDHRSVSISSGGELIGEVRKVSPEMKIIVYSVENRVHPIRDLFESFSIDGYVIKGRNNIPELRKAIQKVYDGGTYVSSEISHLIQDRSLEEIGPYDLEILRMLAEGQNQDQIAEQFRNSDFPSSRSSLEKRLNRLRQILDAKSNFQLIAIAKDLGLI